MTDEQGSRHSLDVLASSTYDAAHLYVAHAKDHPAAQLPVPTPATRLEVMTDGRVYLIKGEALRGWIERRSQEWKGPKGLLFSRRPTL